MAYYNEQGTHWRMEALRVMAAFPHGSRVEEDFEKDIYRVHLPGGAIVYINRHVMAERMSNNKNSLGSKLWNEFMERVKDLPEGADINLDWLNEGGYEEDNSAKPQDLIDALLGKT